MSGPKKHHFVPVFYLRNFCRPDGKLSHYVMRPTDGKTIETRWTDASPKSVGYEKQLYRTADEADGECRIEGELAVEVDGPAKPAIEEILGAKPNTNNIQMPPGAVNFIAFMAMRAPAALKWKKEIAQARADGLVRGDHPNNPGPEGIRKGAAAIRPYLQEIRWHLYRFDGQGGTVLVTSDRPVGIYALAEPGACPGSVLQASPLDAWVPCNWAKQAIFTFPLSPACAVIGFKGTRRELERAINRQIGIECDARLPAWVNGMTAWQANYVYTPEKKATFLLPNPPSGPSKIEFIPRPSGIPRNDFGTIEDFAPLVDQFLKAHAEKVDPRNPAEFMAKAQALRNRGLID